MEQETDIIEAEGSDQYLRTNLGTRTVDTVEAQTKPLLSAEDSPVISYDGAAEESSQYAGLPWWKRPSVALLLVPFLLYATAIGSVAVPRVNLVLSLVCREYYRDRESHMIPGTFTPVKLVLGADNPECEIPEVAAKASMFSLYMNIIAGLLSAITSPRLGQLSDRIGRRRVLILTSSGGFLSEILLIVCYKFPDRVSYWWLLSSSTVEGCLGSFTLTLALSHSYATDCTTFAKRAAAFSLFHGTLFLGIAIGPAIGGFVIEKTNDLLSVFYGVVVVHTIVFCYIVFILPESLSRTKQLLARDKWAESQRRLAETSGSKWLPGLRAMNLFEPLSILWPKKGSNLSKLRLNMILLAGIDFIMFGVGFGVMTVIILYSKIQFHWSIQFSAYFTSIVNSTRVFGLLVILPLLVRLFRAKPVPGAPPQGCDRLDTYIIRAALTAEVLGYLFYLTARSTPVFVLGAVIASFGGIGSPTLQSSLTRHSSPEKTGELLGVIALLHALGRVIGPTIFNSIYSATADSYPQAVFIVLVGVFVVTWIASCFITPYISVDQGDGTEEGEEQERGEVEADESEPLVARS
ncbi:hypothetical protein TWF694_008262 [Orbilia ellipsospora]|uniref:Major facilitator superfamily (MFS) profile domain-containing protein n=1 Tax=Orbilia ellipsospora TaxID=2528407 RepID=A0AAV9XFJ5_9PEZI